jgi:hypothetical protein
MIGGPRIFVDVIRDVLHTAQNVVGYLSIHRSLFLDNEAYSLFPCKADNFIAQVEKLRYPIPTISGGSFW